MAFPQTPASSKGKASSAQDTTPSSRLALANSLGDGAKKRVRDIDPNKNRCLVENCAEERAVDFSHVCPKWFANDEVKMDNIEWYWNMARSTLNLDTRWNIMRLGASIHRLFDKYSWILIPEESIVDRYFQSVSRSGMNFVTTRAKFPEIKSSDSFEYTFIPINGDIMSMIALLRQNDPPQNNPPESSLPHTRGDSHRHDLHRNDPRPNHPRPNDPRPLPKPLTPSDFVTHTYPFDTMPVLKSHVHPKFVILEAGLAMTMFSTGQNVNIIANYPVIRKIISIYEAWIAPRPANWMKDRTYNLPSPDPSNSRGGDADSDYTEPTRRTKPPKRPRHENIPETPTPAAQNQRASGSGTQGKQRALKREPSLCLSKKSLELHDRAIGTENWTPDSVQKWSEKCQPLPDTVHSPWIQFQTGICV